MILTEQNFLLYASKNYDNPNCLSTEEFLEDLNRIKYLKKLFYTFKNKDTLRERLILNHLVVLYNVFEMTACTRMLFFRLDEYYDTLVPFLIYLGYLPEKITLNEKIILTSDISIDPGVVKALRDLDKERR